MLVVLHWIFSNVGVQYTLYVTFSPDENSLLLSRTPNVMEINARV